MFSIVFENLDLFYKWYCSNNIRKRLERNKDTLSPERSNEPPRLNGVGEGNQSYLFRSANFAGAVIGKNKFMRTRTALAVDNAYVASQNAVVDPLLHVSDFAILHDDTVLHFGIDNLRPITD